MDKTHVLVIGGGITGLLVAQGLKKNGIPCTVFEREPSANHYRPKEWGLSVHWGLPLLKDCLPDDLHQRISTASVDPYHTPADPTVMPTLNLATGDTIKDIPLPFMYRMSRRRFRALAAEGIDIQYGKTVRGIVYDDEAMSVTAIFQDESKATGSQVIATDGAQSIIRHLIFGDEEGKALQVPYSVINVHVRYDNAEKAKLIRQIHPIMFNGVHPDGFWSLIAIESVPDPNDPTTWVFQLLTSWRRREGEDATSLEKHKQRTSAWCEPFRTAHAGIPDDMSIQENKVAYWSPRPWDSHGGRIWLAGDAAHPMSFHRGQGMNHGIGDASKIVLELVAATKGDKSFGEACEEYQKEMIERAGAEVKISRQNTIMLHDWNQLANSPIMQQGAAKIN